jgi:hypothetical protein
MYWSWIKGCFILALLHRQRSNDASFFLNPA